MAKRPAKKATKREKGTAKKPIESYDHKDKKRPNNPPVGLVTPATDPNGSSRKTYQYDPHLDPQLVWAGKAEHTSFEVPTVSLHVHERIDPKTIIAAVRKNGGSGKWRVASGQQQMLLFEQPGENPPLREAIEFYKHAHNWTNRLIAGDSLLVMNSLLEKEGMAGKVQMVYIDPPYGIRYGSNFQPFVNKRDVKDGNDDDLTQEPEMIRAFRDTWELGIHSYLTYLRDRLLLARELLHESGSCFVQISDENVHLVRSLLDDVFGPQNFMALVTFVKTASATVVHLASTADYLLWFARDRNRVRFHQPWVEKTSGGAGGGKYDQLTQSDGTRRAMTKVEKDDPGRLPAGSRVFRLDNLTSQSEGRQKGEGAACWFPVRVDDKEYRPSIKGRWKTNEEGMRRLLTADRVAVSGSTLSYVRYIDDFPFFGISNVWTDIGGGVQSRADPKVYVVQTGAGVVERCMLMTTDPGDLVVDPTCGSGTSAFVAEQWGRRWITCDTSRVAIALAKQRLMTALYDYYELAHLNEGVGSGFKYKTVPHITLKSIANNPEIKEGMSRKQIDAAIAKYAEQETLYDQPYVDNKRARVSGPFTVEAVPAPSVRPVDSGEWLVESEDRTGHSPLATHHFAASESRSGVSLRHAEWRDELLKCGIRGKSGQRVEFSRVEALPGTRWLHADGAVESGEWRVESEEQTRHSPLATHHSVAGRVVVSFGPEHAPLEQRQVEQALEEAQLLKPKPKMVVFAAFQFDPEAAKDIDETNWPGITLLKVQMNTDLLTDDLKKKRASNESFWMVGQPDVQVASGEWLVDSGGKMVCPYELGKVLSGLDSLAKINGLDQGDLRLFAAFAQGGDLWADVADASGGGVDPGQHRGGAGKAEYGGVSAVSGHRPGIVGRIGDADRLIERLGLRDERKRRTFVERLRRDKQVAQRAAQSTLHSPLTTRHYAQVEVHGFDYYNPITGKIESGDTTKIAMWMLDTDYDGRSLYPRQVFFPMAGPKDGWARLARNLKAEIDEDLIEAYRGTVSLPFEPGGHKRVAVKIIDDRGIESLKIVEMAG